MMTADEAIWLTQPSSESRKSKYLSFNNDIKVQTIFDTQIAIQINKDQNEKNQSSFSILNMQGQNVLEKHFDETPSSCFLPTENLPIGMYILQIKINDNVKSFRIIKP